MISRRTLGRGLLGGLAVGATGLGWVFVGGYGLPDGDTPLATSHKEWAVVRALVEALLPEADGLPSGLSIGVHTRVDEELWSCDQATADSLRRGLAMIELAPLLMGQGSRLSRLPPQTRVSAFEAIMASSKRPLASAAKSWLRLLHLFYYADSRTYAAIGYDGPWVKTAVPTPSGLAYAAALAARRAAS